METTDKIIQTYKKAVESEKPIAFPEMDAVWNQIEKKLDEEHTIIFPIWKKWLIAATVLFILGIGSFVWFNQNNKKDIVVKNTNEKTKSNILKNQPTIQQLDSSYIDKKDIIVAKKKKKINYKNDVAINKRAKISELYKNNIASIAEQKAIEKNTIAQPAQIESLAYNQKGLSKELERKGPERSKQIGNNLRKNKSNTLDEVVVVGYRATQHKLITGSMTSINPTSNNSYRLRGSQSITENQHPLYIVNGNVLDNNKIDLKSIDPNNIKSIEVLKNEKATAIYGARGKNGVVIITTKNPFDFPAKNTNTEEYETFKENAFVSPLSNPFSTFSIDVDNASYTNIRRLINNGQKVPKDAVRIEEMINFFKYRTPQPKDDMPYAVHTEASIAPWNPQHNLLKISLQGKIIPEKNIPPSNLVFLIDVSGSMYDANKLPLLQSSLKLLVHKLRAEDKVAIVTYAGNAGLVLPSTSGKDKQTIINAIENLKAGGSTAGAAGIELAYKVGQENFIKNGNNRIVLATDGDFNVGVSSNQDLETLISEKRKSHIFLTCLGFGMGNYKDSKMQTLSQKGNGNYAYVDNIQEANRVLVKEFGGTMFTIAKDVKLQVEFNPKKVKAYRLIGYETRLLADQDFADDSIDAGEMGSGHTVTALYEIIPSNIKDDRFYNNSLEPRYVHPAEKYPSNELGFIKTRYKLPESNTSIEKSIPINFKIEKSKNISADYRLATTVAWFGLKLRDSQLIADKSTQDILNWGKTIQYDDPDGYIAELFRLIESQQP